MALRLLAVDADETVVREDGFVIEENPETGIVRRLKVATVLPGGFKISPAVFTRNIYRVQGEQAPSLHEQKSFLNPGLHVSVGKSVLVAVYEHREDDEFPYAERLETDEATIIPMNFVDLAERRDFQKIKTSIEDFLIQDDRVWNKYKNYTKGIGTGHWAKDTAAHRLIAGLSHLFNRTCSLFAYQQRIKTLRKRDVEISFKEHAHEVLVFNAPVRKAEGYVNLGNLMAHLHGNPPPHTPDTLRQLGLEL